MWTPHSQLHSKPVSGKFGDENSNGTDSIMNQWLENSNLELKFLYEKSAAECTHWISMGTLRRDIESSEKNDNRILIWNPNSLFSKS